MCAYIIKNVYFTVSEASDLTPPGTPHMNRSRVTSKLDMNEAGEAPKPLLKKQDKHRRESRTHLYRLAVIKYIQIYMMYLQFSLNEVNF